MEHFHYDLNNDNNDIMTDPSFNAYTTSASTTPYHRPHDHPNYHNGLNAPFYRPPPTETQSQSYPFGMQDYRGPGYTPSIWPTINTNAPVDQTFGHAQQFATGLPWLEQSVLDASPAHPTAQTWNPSSPSSLLFASPIDEFRSPITADMAFPPPLYSHADSIPQIFSRGTSNSLIDGTQSTTSTSTDNVFITQSFPEPTEDHRNKRIALHKVMTSEWRRIHQREPDEYMLLQFMNYDAETKRWSCTFWSKGAPCKCSCHKRDHAKNHIRHHIKHHPYACELPCPAGDPKCTKRYPAPEPLSKHRKGSAPCSYCGQVMLLGNMSRHQTSTSCKGSQSSEN